jgi:uncharacterized membrane protein YdbT with pleckstrin-like domain
MDSMNPKDVNSGNSSFSRPEKVRNPLEVMQPEEEIIYEIKRHPAGIFGLYIGAGLLLVIMAIAAFIFVTYVFGSDNSAVMILSGIVFFIVSFLVLVFVFISTVVYWGNHWIVTTDSLTQISQMNMFRKQSAQLSLESLEDISSEKQGVFAQLFNYGTLRAETAGEREKFMFRYCPDPDNYAQKLLAAREAYQRDQHDKESTASKSGPDSSATSTVEQLGQAALADFPDSNRQSS